MLTTIRPDALGLIGRAAGQSPPVSPVPPAGAVTARAPAHRATGTDGDAEQLRGFLANITRADPTAIIELTEQATRNQAKASYDDVVSSYGRF